MFQRKLIAVFGAVALLVVAVGVSEASLSRVEGMGLTSPFLSQFTDDYANIYTYPTSVVRQNNLVLAELGTNSTGQVDPVDFSDQSFTIIKNFPSFGAIAFQMKQGALNTLNTSNSNIVNTFPDPSNTGGIVNSLNNEQLDLIWGKGFEKMDLAVRFDATNSSIETSDNTADNTKTKGADFGNPFAPYPFGATFLPNEIVNNGVELNTWGVTPSIALHMSNDNRVEGAVTFRRYSLDRSATVGGVAGESWKDDGNLSYAVLVRGILNAANNATWYPAVWYVNDDLSYTVKNVAPTDRKVDEKYKNFGAGLSHNMRVNDNNLLIFGVAGMESKHTYERQDNNDAVANADIRTEEDKVTLAPLFFGSLETDATHWLKVRIGASRSLSNTHVDETDFSAASVSGKLRVADFNFSLGTGIKWNNLDIDMVLNNAFPLSGGWILSGDPETPFTRASATYHF
jgi:hypothetical protein